jgi:hypothetical protein
LLISLIIGAKIRFNRDMSNNGEGPVLLPGKAARGFLPIDPGVAGKPGVILEDITQGYYETFYYPIHTFGK